MICPNCQADYREGFRRCADCGVDLVEASPGSIRAPVTKEFAGHPEDPFCEFWRGDDPRVRAELCGLLSEVNIPYRTTEWQDHLFNRTRFPVFRIAIPFSMFDKAEKVVTEAYGGAEEVASVMNPTEASRPEFRKLLELPLEEKLKEAAPEEPPASWEDLTWERKRRKSEGTKTDDQQEPKEEG